MKNRANCGPPEWNFITRLALPTPLTLATGLLMPELGFWGTHIPNGKWIASGTRNVGFCTLSVEVQNTATGVPTSVLKYGIIWDIENPDPGHCTA